MQVLNIQSVTQFTDAVLRCLKIFHPTASLTSFIGIDVKQVHTPITDEVHRCAEQVDAFVDIVYYIFNYLVKQGNTRFVDDPIFGKMFNDVKVFTCESNGVEEYPSYYDTTLKDKDFIVAMVISELCELIDTITLTKQDTIGLITMYCKAADTETPRTFIDEYICKVVMWCYIYSKKTNIDFGEVFNLVHEANMNKRINGKFIKRDDGKIIKPCGWVAPDVYGYIVKKITV